jgi:hypothetical protein
MSKTAKSILLLLFCVSSLAFGLGYNPDENLGTDLENIAAKFSPHPPDSTVVGIQWLHYEGWFATATVIAPNYIITAGHWNTFDSPDPNWPIGYHLKKLGNEPLKGTEYIIVDARAAFDVKKLQSRVPTPDLMICRVKRTDPADPNSSPEKYASLKDANFPQWIPLYEGSSEVGLMMTTGSFGTIEKSAKTWCVCTEEEKKLIPPLRGAGLLHWGRNRITRADKDYILFTFDAPGTGDYVPGECYGAYGSSGAPLFVQDAKRNWTLAGVMTTCTGGPRISQWIGWFNKQILDMEKGIPSPASGR